MPPKSIGACASCSHDAARASIGLRPSTTICSPQPRPGRDHPLSDRSCVRRDGIGRSASPPGGQKNGHHLGAHLSAIFGSPTRDRSWDTLPKARCVEHREEPNEFDQLQNGYARCGHVAAFHNGVVDSAAPASANPGSPIGEIRNAAAARITQGDVAGGLELWLDRDQPGTWARRSDASRQMSRDNAWTVLAPSEASPVTGDDVAGLKMPVLLMQGEKIARPMMSIVDATSRCLPSATRVMIPDAGHPMQLDNPAAFRVALLKFLLVWDFIFVVNGRFEERTRIGLSCWRPSDCPVCVGTGEGDSVRSQQEAGP